MADSPFSVLLRAREGSGRGSTHPSLTPLGDDPQWADPVYRCGYLLRPRQAKLAGMSLETA